METSSKPAWFCGSDYTADARNERLAKDFRQEKIFYTFITKQQSADKDLNKEAHNYRLDHLLLTACFHFAALLSKQ